MGAHVVKWVGWVMVGANRITSIMCARVRGGGMGAAGANTPTNGRHTDAAIRSRADVDDELLHWLGGSERYK